MPYVIQKICSGTDTACMDACPFDCIHPEKDEISLKPLFYVDAEQCTDCGACALVCPEGAIAPVAEYGRYAGVSAGVQGGSYESHLELATTERDQPRAVEIIAQELLTAFVASHV